MYGTSALWRTWIERLRDPQAGALGLVLNQAPEPSPSAPLRASRREAPYGPLSRRRSIILASQ